MGADTHSGRTALTTLALLLVFVFAASLLAADGDTLEATTVEAEARSDGASADAPAPTLDTRMEDVEARVEDLRQRTINNRADLTNLEDRVPKPPRDIATTNRSLGWIRQVLIVVVCLSAVLACAVGFLLWRELAPGVPEASTGVEDGIESSQPAGTDDGTALVPDGGAQIGMFAVPEFVASMARLADAVTAAAEEMREGFSAMREERRAGEAVHDAQEAEQEPDGIQELWDRYVEGGGLVLVGGGAYERLNRALVYVGAWCHSAADRQGLVDLCQEIEEYLQDELRKLRSVAPMPDMRTPVDDSERISAAERARVELGAHQRRCEQGYAPSRGGALGEHVRHVMTLLLQSEYVTPGSVPEQFAQIAGVLGAKTFAPTPGDPLADARHEQASREPNSQYGVDDIVRVESLGAETGDGSVIVRAQVVVSNGHPPR